MRMYGPGKEVADLAARQALAVNGNRLHSLHQGLGCEGMGSGSVAGQTFVSVWDACRTIETWPFYILPVLTPPELTFILSWEGMLG